MIDVTRLREKRQRKLDEMSEIVERAEGEDRGLTQEERTLYDTLQASVTDLDGRISRAEEANRQEELSAQPAGGPPVHRRSGPQTPPNATPPNAEIGMGANDVRRYSLVRAIRASAAARQGDLHAWDEAGLEMEASRAVAQQLGREPQGFFVPFDIQNERRTTTTERRDLNVGTPTAGGNLVATDLLAQNFIELLRNRIMARQAGATMLTGLVGDIAIPRQSGGATAYWVGEGSSPTESQQTVDQVALSPETVGAFTDYTRKLLLQSSLDVEMFVRSDLAAILALAIDLAALHGTGSGNQPTGVALVSGIGSVVGGANGAAPDWADIVNLETEVAIDNADIGRLAYMTNARVRGKLKQTEKATNTGMFVWTDNATPLNGYGAFATNQVRSDLDKGTSVGVCSAIFFANWADLILAFWSGLDVLVDPYTGGTAGTVRVIALQDVDIDVRHPQSFAAMLDALTT